MLDKKLLNETIALLDKLISLPSVSREETATADAVCMFLRSKGIAHNRLFNNVWALNRDYDPAKPTLMLNSHHDTVKPSPAYTDNPFTPIHRDGRIYGLGSNDAGASVVSLIETFCSYYDVDLPFNLLLAITAEEEVMGEHGMRALLPELERRNINVSMAVVGEPTGMNAAVGERGLVVLDCTAHGKSGHAAREEGVNAIYAAIKDIDRLRSFRFEKESQLLGPIKITVTQIAAGTQHNVIPDECRFVVDVRTTDAYTNEQTVELLRDAIDSDAVPRSTRVRASAIDDSHPLVRAAVALGRKTFVSPTTSDMALMAEFPSLKMGVGESARSHTAGEYILEQELEEGLELYHRYIAQLAKELNQKQ